MTHILVRHFSKLSIRSPHLLPRSQILHRVQHLHPYSSTQAMPPRRSLTASAATVDRKPESASPLSSAESSGTTLVQALEHIPATGLKLDPNSSGDELTPPPDITQDDKEGIVDEAVDNVMSKVKRKRATKKAVYAEPSGSETEVAPTKRRNGSKKDVDYSHSEASEEVEEPEEPIEVVTPKKVRKKAVKKVKVEGDDDGEVKEAKEKTPKKPTPKKSRVAKDEPEFDEEGNEIIKKKRKVKEYVKKVYEIPDVEKKETTFKGRLGYACLNTVLRSTKPDSIFCSRTCRIASIEEEGMELPKGLALMNVRDLKTMIEWNEQNKIRFMRMSSEMFPFASHAKYGYDLSFAAEGLKEAGDLAKKYGHRLTMHPGQFTQLGSPKDNVVVASLRELDYQCEIMDRMGLDQDGVMIIHMGGVYGDKPTTLARFKENYTTRVKDNVKRRLVLENDEICYNVDDLLPLCNELEIPIIFDYHHDWINPSSEPPSVLIPKIAETWKKKGIKMKQHLSEPRPGAESVMERRAHSDRCKNLPEALPDDVDLMIEAKDKEQAVFELYRMYGLEEVIHDNLRPPNPNPSMHTNGRKSSLKKKVKDTGLLDEDGNPIELDDIEKEGDGGMGDEGLTDNRVEGLEDVDGDIKMELKSEEGKKGKKTKGAVGGKAKKDAAKKGLTKIKSEGNGKDSTEPISALAGAEAGTPVKLEEGAPVDEAAQANEKAEEPKPRRGRKSTVEA